MAANQPVSLSSAFNRLVRVLMTSSECRLLRILVWPSGFVARQLNAKHAFLLAPVSSQHNIFAKADICERKFKRSNQQKTLQLMNYLMYQNFVVTPLYKLPFFKKKPTYFPVMFNI